MPRAPLIRSQLPYHVYARSNNKEWFYLPQDIIWEIFCRRINTLKEKYVFQIHNFVLMSNHFHLIISTPNYDLDKIMRWLMREVSREINFRTERINHVFGGPYKWSLIDNPVYYKIAYRYVAQNPTRSGFTVRIENYPYSIFYYVKRGLRVPFEVSDHYFGQSSLSGEILKSFDWLNSNFSELEYHSIQLGLKHKIFKLNKKHKGTLSLMSDKYEIHDTKILNATI
jgi:REP element-mobilizing transposase RayT